MHIYNIYIYTYIYIYIYICIHTYTYIYIYVNTIKNNINYKNDKSNSNERKLSYYLKEILLVYKFYIICMDLQWVPNSLFLI